MSAIVRDWLPLETADSARIRTLAGEVVDSWSRKWLAANAAAAGFEVRRGKAPPHPGGWRRPGAAIGIALGAAEMIRLAGAALGPAPERFVLSEVDRDILSRFTATLAADLAQAVEQALGFAPAGTEGSACADPLADAGGLLFDAVDSQGRVLAHVAIPHDALVPTLKAAIRPRRRGLPPAARLSQAYGATAVRIEARLGAAALPLGEVAALAPGDVLILDRTIEEGAAVSLAGSGKAFARGVIDASAHALSLILSSQPRES